MIQVTFALFSNDAFWMNMTVKSLGLLLSVSNEFKNELGLKQNTPEGMKKILELILNHGDPLLREITVKEAVARFALTMPSILHYCSGLPKESPFHCLKLRGYYKIPFMVAFTLALERKGGLQKVAKLKVAKLAIQDKTTEKIVVASRSVLIKAQVNLGQMMDGISQAITTLKNVQNREKFLGRITILKTVRETILRVDAMTEWLRYVLETPQLNKDRVIIRKATKTLKDQHDTLVRRYNSHHRLGQYEMITVLISE